MSLPDTSAQTRGSSICVPIPVAQLQIGRESGHEQAREATDEEIERLWPRLIELWPAYQAHYERSGQRAIFILEPA